MGGMSPIHWVIVAVAAALLFGGRGKLSSIMGDAAKGIRAFKDGLKDDEHAAKPAPSPHITTVVQPVETAERDRADFRG